MNAMQHVSPSTPDASVRWSHRDIPLSHASHLCGRVAWTPGPQSVAVESQLEARVLGSLLVHTHPVAVHSQPFTLAYVHAGRRRRYTPDFLLVFDHLSRTLVHLGFGFWTVVEVKPASWMDIHCEELAMRLQAVHDLLGLATVCLTERDLDTGRALS